MHGGMRQMRTFKWAAAPVILTTLLLLAVAAVLLSRNDARSARLPVAEPVAREAQPQTAARSVAPKQAAAKANTNSAQRTTVASQPAKPIAQAAPKAPAKPQAAPAANAKAQSAALANPLGWRQGTRWKVAVEQYNTQLATPRWVSSEYQYNVIAANAQSKSFVVSMSLADQASQPETARGDILRAGYELRNGALELAWVQPLGKGRKLSPEEAEMLLGENALPLEVPASPFAGGTDLTVSAAGLGKVQANRVALGQGETASFAKGAPWWVNYAKGKNLKAKLTSFEP